MDFDVGKYTQETLTLKYEDLMIDTELKHGQVCCQVPAVCPSFLMCKALASLSHELWLLVVVLALFCFS